MVDLLELLTCDQINVFPQQVLFQCMFLLTSEIGTNVVLHYLLLLFFAYICLAIADIFFLIFIMLYSFIMAIIFFNIK